MALLDVTRPLQKQNAEELLRENRELQNAFKEVKSLLDKEAIQEGYSSLELEDPDSKKVKNQ